MAQHEHKWEEEKYDKPEPVYCLSSVQNSNERNEKQTLIPGTLNEDSTVQSIF